MTKPDFRAVGFTDKAIDYPRDEFALAMFAAFNGVKPEQMPEPARYFPNEATAKAWGRVAEAARVHLAAPAPAQAPSAVVPVEPGLSLTELADRVEKGEGPDRPLEVEIWRRIDGGHATREPLPWLCCYTESVSDSLDLLKRRLPEWFVQNFSEWQHPRLRDGGPWMAQLKRKESTDADFSVARADHAKHPARAMTAAILRGLDWIEQNQRKAMQ